MKKISVTLSLLCIMSSLAAQWTAVGPFGGRIGAAIEVNGDLLSGTNSGIYRSTNGGQSFSAWSRSLPSGNVIDLYQEGAYLFACIFERGIYRSADNGVTWTLVLQGRYLRQDGFGQSRIQKVGSHIMVRNYNDSNDTLFFSSDAGATWIRRPVQGNMFNNIYGFGNSLFGYNSAGVWGPQTGLYRSDDLAQTWTFAGTGMPAGQYVGQIVSFTDTLYALTKDIFRSVDGGSNWSKVTTDTLPTVGGGYAFFPEWFIKVGNTVFAQNGGNFNVKVASWRPGQSGWRDSYTGIPTQGSTTTFYNIGTKVFLSREEKVVYTTTGPGQPWTTASFDGINALVHNDLFARGNEVLSTSGSTIRNGSDGSSTWSINNPANINNDYGLYGIARVGNSYLMGVENAFGVLDIYQSASPGGPWTNKAIYDISPRAKLLPKGDTLVVYGAIGGDPACFLIKSDGTDLGGLSSGLFGFSFDDGAYSMTAHKGDLYCVVTGFVNNLSKIRKYNLPSGTFWQQVAEKIDNQFFGATSIISFQDKLFLGMIGGGVKVSDNDGSNWTDLNSGLNGAVVQQFLVADSFLLAATDKGVYRIKSGETSWTDLSFDLVGGNVSKVAITPGYLWALVEGGGVWRLLREGNVAVDSDPQALAFSLSPNPAGQTITLSLAPSFEDSRWQICNMQGRICMEGSLPAGQSRQQLDLDHLPAGIYLCRLTQGAHTATQKWIKH